MPSTELTVRKTYELSELKGIAEVFAKSGYFKDASDAAKAFVKVLAGQELGIPPMQAMVNIHIVEGKPELGYQIIGALIQRSGKYHYRVDLLTDQECAITFFQDAEPIGISRFTLEDARTAGIYRNTWMKYPRNMLMARALTNGANWYCPEVLGGLIYSEGEISGEPPEPEAAEPVVGTEYVNVHDVIDAETGEILDAEVLEESGPEQDGEADTAGGGASRTDSGPEKRRRTREARCSCGHTMRSHPDGGPCKAKECECGVFDRSVRDCGESSGEDETVEAAARPAAPPAPGPSPEPEPSPFRVPAKALSVPEQIIGLAAKLDADGRLPKRKLDAALVAEHGTTDVGRLSRPAASNLLERLRKFDENTPVAA